MSLEKKGVHRPEYIREATPEMKDFLCDNADVITKLTIAAENPTVQYIPDFVKAGIIVSIGHSNATYEVAKAALQTAFPDREIVGINCLPLIKQHGSLHCVTMQYPKEFIV